MTASLLWTAVQLRPQQDSRCAGACQATHLEVWPNQPQIITREAATGGKKITGLVQRLCVIQELDLGSGQRGSQVGMEGLQVFFTFSIGVPFLG